MPHPLLNDVDILFVKRREGACKIWWVPKNEKGHFLPDIHWWRLGVECSDLSPDFNTDELRCKDQSVGWFADNFRWSLNGQALYPGLDNLIEVDGIKEESLYFIKGIKQD